MASLITRLLFLAPSITAFGILIASPAQAVVFNIRGNNYDIEVVKGTSVALLNQLQATPWYKNQALAVETASVVGTYFGTPNVFLSNYQAAPYFNYDYQMPPNAVYPEFWVYTNYTTDPRYPFAFINGNISVINPDFYAVINPTSVPEPLTILGSIAAIGLLQVIERKFRAKK